MSFTLHQHIQQGTEACSQFSSLRKKVCVTHQDPAGPPRRQRSEALVPAAPVLQCRLSKYSPPVWAGPGGRYLYKRVIDADCYIGVLENRSRPKGFSFCTWGYFHNGLRHLQLDWKAAGFLRLHEADDAVAILQQQEIQGTDLQGTAETEVRFSIKTKQPLQRMRINKYMKTVDTD